MTTQDERITNEYKFVEIEGNFFTPPTHAAGVIVFLANAFDNNIIVKGPGGSLNPKDLFVFEEVPQTVRLQLNDLCKRVQPSTYNEMYKHISGSKEFSFSFHEPSCTWKWGVFHRDGVVTGWFCHRSDQEKKEGTFFIVKGKGVFGSLTKEWEVVVSMNTVGHAATQEEAWKIMNKALVEILEKDGGIPAIMLLEATYIVTKNHQIIGFERLRDMAHENNWEIITPKKSTKEVDNESV